MLWAEVWSQYGSVEEPVRHFGGEVLTSLGEESPEGIVGLQSLHACWLRREKHSTLLLPWCAALTSTPVVSTVPC